MTERLEYTPPNPEEEPFAELNLPNGEVFLAKRDTATLFTFMGALAVYNHVFCYELKDEEVEQSFYIFSHVDGYDRLVNYMLEESYPAVLNQLSVSPSDQEAYIRSSMRDLGDGLPADWK